MRIRTTFLRTAALGALVLGFGSQASAEQCRDASDCYRPFGVWSAVMASDGGCYVGRCARADASICNTPDNQPVDPSCSCSYPSPTGASCRINPVVLPGGQISTVPVSCGTCQADNVCTSDDADQDGVCLAQDNCPALPTADRDNLDGDAVGDLCDDEDAVPYLRSFAVNASSRDLLTGTYRANGKIQAKGMLMDHTWRPTMSEVAVIVSAAHPAAPFDQRWVLPCTVRGTSTYCERRGATRNEPTIKVKFRGTNPVSIDIKAQNLILAAVPSLVPAPGVLPEKYLPAVSIVTLANTQYPLGTYATAPSPMTGVDHVATRIGDTGAEGWTCRTSSVGTPKLNCRR